MTNKEINERKNKIIKKIANNELSFIEESIWAKNLDNFIQNEEKKKNKEFLLDIVENISWYNESERYIENKLSVLIDNVGFEKRLLYIIKDKLDSSNHSITSKLAAKGNFSNNDMIQFFEVNVQTKKIEQKNLPDNCAMVLIDDYVGTGNSIISVLKSIDNTYENLDVYIIAYVYQEKALENIRDYISKHNNNNHFIFDVQNLIIENRYNDKFESDKEILNYIISICNTCTDKKNKFGYNNTGAMVAIDKLAPNNDISLLWRNNLGDGKWSPFLSRDIKLQQIIKKKEKIIKNNDSLIKYYYNKFFYRYLMPFREFKSLMLLYYSYKTNLDELKDLLGLDTIQDVKILIEKFEKNGIIDYEDNRIVFRDFCILKEIKKVDNCLQKCVLEVQKNESKDKFIS